MIKKCFCSNQYQDNRYGQHMRVANPQKRGTGPQEYRCTVCGRTITRDAKPEGVKK